MAAFCGWDGFDSTARHPGIIADEKHSRQESRHHALGKTDDGRLLHIAFTLRKAANMIRVIAARDMQRKK